MIRSSLPALCFVLTLTPASLGQTPGGFAGATRLDYTRASGAESCPDADSWRDAVIAKIEGAADPFQPAGPNILRVTMERRATDYRAAFELLDAAGHSRGTREQTGPTCRDAARALATSASLLFIARPTAPPPTPALPSSQPQASVAQTTTTAPPPPPASAPRPALRRWRVQLGAGGAAVLGFSPTIAPGFTGFAGVRFPLGDAESGPALSLSVEGRGDLSAMGDPIHGPEGQTAQVRAAFAGGTLAPCVHGAGYLVGCLLLTAGQTSASLGEGTTPTTQTALFVGFGGRFGAELSLLRGQPTIALRLAVDGWFSLVRPEARIAGVPVWTAPAGAGALGAYVLTLF